MTRVLNDVKETTSKSAHTSAPLSRDELRKTNAYWRACNYLAAGMIYLRDNPLLREPLKVEHVKQRLFGSLGRQPRVEFHLHSSESID